MAKAKGLEIDRRVGIALSVIPQAQKVAVERLLRSAQSFANGAAIPGRVRMMRTSGQPLYMMRVSPSLRLIYTLVGDTVYVLDVVERATLDRFALSKSAKKAAKAKVDKKASKADAEKTPVAVKK
jgi:hypothetical protein